MAQQQLAVITRPDEAALNEAIGALKQPVTDGSALLRTGLVIIGEACAQLENEQKSREEVIASLTARGLSEGAAAPLVDKAIEVVKGNAGLDQQIAAEADKGGVGLLPIILVAVVIIAVFLFWRS